MSMIHCCLTEKSNARGEEEKKDDWKTTRMTSAKWRFCVSSAFFWEFFVLHCLCLQIQPKSERDPLSCTCTSREKEGKAWLLMGKCAVVSLSWWSFPADFHVVFSFVCIRAMCSKRALINKLQKRKKKLNSTSSLQVGIFGPPDTLYQGGYFKVSLTGHQFVVSCIAFTLCNRSRLIINSRETRASHQFISCWLAFLHKNCVCSSQVRQNIMWCEVYSLFSRWQWPLSSYFFFLGFFCFASPSQSLDSR